MRKTIFALMAALAWGWIPLPSAAAEDGPSVTPYRPTVSNPAELSEPGWLEMEAGWNKTKGGDNAWRESLPYLFKYAFTPDFGVMLGGDAAVSQTDLDGNLLSGAGDTTLMLKNKWSLGGEDGPALGLEYGFKSPTAKTGLGNGKTDCIVNGIYSTEADGNTVDLNLNLTRLGEALPGESRHQWGWATAVSRALNEKWGVAAELSGNWRKGVAPINQFLASASYVLNRRVVFDVGAATGISQSSQSWGLIAGVSILLDKLR